MDAFIVSTDDHYFCLFNSDPFSLPSSSTMSDNCCKSSIFSAIYTMSSAYLKLLTLCPLTLIPVYLSRLHIIFPLQIEKRPGESTHPSLARRFIFRVTKTIRDEKFTLYLPKWLIHSGSFHSDENTYCTECLKHFVSSQSDQNTLYTCPKWLKHFLPVQSDGTTLYLFRVTKNNLYLFRVTKTFCILKKELNSFYL